MKLRPRKVLELEVPGLAEKRPSLIAGDIVNIRPYEDHTAYKGIVHQINDSNIWIEGVNPELAQYIEESLDLELDGAFQVRRLPFEIMHAGMDQWVFNGLLNVLLLLLIVDSP